MIYKLDNPIFGIIGRVADRLNNETFVVGGYVRDIIMERSTSDIDIVTVGSGIELAKQVAKELGNKKISIFKNFGTAMFKYKNIDIEFIGARKESYRKNSRKPIVESGTLQDDQLRRDFTINAMAISLNSATFGQLTDPFNGIEDIKNKIIRTPRDPKITFSDDPLRMMRAVRFASQLGFTIEENTYEAITVNKDRLKIVSFERIIDEFNKILLSPKPSTGIKLLSKTGLLEIFLPEIERLKGVEVIDGKGHKDNFYHTVEVVDNVAQKTRNLWLIWSALLHDIGKPATKQYVKGEGWTFHGHDFVGSKMVPNIFRRLRMPLNDKMKYVKKLVALHLRPIYLTKDDITDSAIRRLIFDAGDDIDDLMLLCEADITSKIEAKKRKYLENFRIVKQRIKEVEEKDAIRNFQPPITGEIIMKTFGLKPSKEIGIIKDAIKNAILDGIIRNDYDEAYDFMIKKAEEIGLKPIEK